MPYTFYPIHWLNFFHISKKFLALLLLPLLRGIFSAMFSDFQGWLAGSPFDLFVLVLLFSLSLATYLQFRYTFSQTHLIIQQGLFNKTYYSIPFSSISSIGLEYPVLARPFKGVKFFANTSLSLPFPFGKKSRIYLFVHQNYGEMIAAHFSPPCSSLSKPFFVQRPFLLILLSFISGQSFGGVLAFVVILNRTSHVLGAHFAQDILNNLQSFSTFLPSIISPVFTFFILIILVGYFFAFLRHVIEYHNFTLVQEGEHLYISYGTFTKRRYFLSLKEIYALDLQQNLLMRLFRLYSVKISVCGYGKRTKVSPILFPAIDQGSLVSTLSSLLPQFPIPSLSIPVSSPYVFSFFKTTMLLVLLTFLSPFLSFLSPHFYPFLPLIFVFLLLFSCLTFFSSFLYLRHGGVGFTPSTICLFYSKYLSFHQVVFPTNTLGKIQIRQGFWRKNSALYDYLIFTLSDGRSVHKVKNLPFPPKTEDGDPLFFP